jgi:hypothetical protein
MTKLQLLQVVLVRFIRWNGGSVDGATSETDVFMEDDEEALLGMTQLISVPGPY